MNIMATYKKLFAKTVLITGLVLTILLASGDYTVYAQTTSSQVPNMSCVKCR